MGPLRLAPRRLPTILVTHDEGEAEALGDRVLVIERGRVPPPLGGHDTETEAR